VFLDHFNVLILKKNKKYYFNIFLNKKHFEKQPPATLLIVKVTGKKQIIDNY
jgi:hypothetical protein